MENIDLESEIITVNINDLIPHENQPRVNEEEGIDELAKSISEHGLMYKPKVSRHPKIPDRYYIIGGHRRIRALKKLGIKYLKVELVNEESPMMPLLDNLHRSELSIIELGLFMKKMLDSNVFSSYKDLAENTGFKTSYISTVVKIANLNKKIIQELNKFKGFKFLESSYILTKLKQLSDKGVSDKELIALIKEIGKFEEEEGYSQKKIVAMINGILNEEEQETEPKPNNKEKEEQQEDEEEELFGSFEIEDFEEVKEETNTEEENYITKTSFPGFKLTKNSLNTIFSLSIEVEKIRNKNKEDILNELSILMKSIEEI